MPEILSTKNIYKGSIFNVERARIRDGEKEYDRDIVTHPGSCVIIPLFEDNTVALVRQYRHPAGKYLLELPAGSLEKGEDSRTGAIRELEEEIGVRAATVELISEFWVSPGFLTEKMYLYLATNLTQTQQNLDEDENIEIIRLPLTEARDLVNNGEIQDAKTVVGLMLATQS